MKKRNKLLVAVLAALLTGKSVRAEEITVAAAADLKFALQDAAEQFEKQTGNAANVTYGSSGNFFTQIQNGAPFDLFFSADMDYPRKLATADLADPWTLYEYAMGRIVIWVPAESSVDAVKQGWEALLDPTVKYIAIANPEHAPYGRAAVAALKRAGIYGKVQAKLVFGENISQAAQFVESGNAQAGILALSLALSPALKGKGSYWLIPAEAHPPIEQGAILVNASTKKKTARAFLEFMRSAAGHAILEKYGYTVPQNDSGRNPPAPASAP